MADLLKSAMGVSVLSLSLLAGCGGPPVPADPPPIPTIPAARAEWGTVYVLEDAEVTVHLAPAVGRVMHLSPRDGANLLWVSDDPNRESFGGWKSFGGEKLWPWPQDGAWGWPPPRAIDTGPYDCRPLSGRRRGVTLAGPVDPASGLSARRDTWLDEGRVMSRYTLHRRQPPLKPGEVAAWSVVQVPPVSAVYVRLLPGQTAAPATQPLSAEPVGRRWMKVTPRYDGSKLYLPGDAVAAVIGDRVLLIERVGDAAGLDLAHAAQVYFHRTPKGRGADDPSVFVELELIGPSRPLAVGESCTLETRWTILPVNELQQLLLQEAPAAGG